MSTLREAAQQALEALDSDHPDVQLRAAVVLRAALAQQEQEPVAWRFKGMMGMPWSLSDDGYYVSCKRDKGYIVEPLYTAPPRREWRGLSAEEFWSLPKARGWFPGDHYRLTKLTRAIEAALKEKNHE